MTRTFPIRTFAAGIGAVALVAGPAVMASADTEVAPPAEFTSAFTVTATPDTIINNDGESVPGEEGGMGAFTYMINSNEEIICYELELMGVTPPYQSPARTATHIHEGDAGSAGPPRIAFPDPTGSGDTLMSSGCMQGPFTTGIEDDNGDDTGMGFSLAQIEANPSAFFGDTHTEAYPAGAVRGQLQQIPVGGVETGLGGAVSGSANGAPLALIAGGAALGLGAVVLTGAAVRRRQGAIN